MKDLLILTQKVDRNDDILGFFHEWIREFASRWEKVVVICLKLGQYDLPDNVKVLSLGKEEENFQFSTQHQSKARCWTSPAPKRSFWCGVFNFQSIFNFKIFKKLKYLGRLLKYIWRERNNYDAVFVHMNPKYVPLGWPVWKLFGKKISLWYAHGHVPLMLKIADRLTDIAFASTPEGYRLKSEKLRIVGQGIDIGKFKNQKSKIKVDEGTFNIVSAGRISPSKDYETLIGAVEELGARRDALKIEIAGSPMNPHDFNYLVKLKKVLLEKNLNSAINFVGPIPNKDLPDFLNSGDLFVNMSHTGSLDKAVLEAMACGLPVLTCNEALQGVLGARAGELMFKKKDFKDLAGKIKFMMNMSRKERKLLGEELRQIVVKDHKLENLIDKISAALKFGPGAQDDIGKIFNEKARNNSEDGYEYHRWLSSPVKRAGYEMTLGAIRRHILEDRPVFNNYLEVGPGAGTWTKLFFEANSKASFDLVDISGEMLELAKKNIGERANIRYFKSDFLRFTTEKKYDLFFSSRVIEYVPDKESAVSKISDLLQSGGRGFIITKNPKYLRSKLTGRQVQELHRGQITSQGLVKLLAANGLKNVEIYPVTFVFPLLRSVFLNKLLYKLFSGRELNLVSKFLAESYAVKFEKHEELTRLSQEVSQKYQISNIKNQNDKSKCKIF